jgi:fucose 4-O-acetylase-like acetyltransferase
MINKYIQSITGFGILLVVIGHAAGVLPERIPEIAATDTMYQIYTQLHTVIYTFHMPLFFCISGFLYFHSGSNFKLGWPAFLQKKTARLLIPYVAISTFVYPLKVLVSSFALRPQTLDLATYVNALIFPWQNPIVFFWFLPTLFVMLILAKCLIKKDKTIVNDTVLLVAACVMFFVFKHQQLDGVLAFMNIGGVLHNFIFFLFGVYVSKYCDGFVLKEKVSMWQALPFFLILPLVSLAEKTPIILFLFAIFGTSFSLLMVKSYPLPIFETFGKYAYQIYLLSWFPQIFIRILFGQIWFVSIWLNIILSVTFGLLVPILVVKLLDKFPIKFVNKCLAIK